MNPEAIRCRLRLSEREIARHAGCTIAEVMRFERAHALTPAVLERLESVYRSMSGEESPADRHHRIRSTKHTHDAEQKRRKDL